MRGRRERVTMIAHGATSGADDVVVTGKLETFRVDTRDTFDFSGRRIPSSDDMVRVTIVMYLDPRDAEVFRHQQAAPRTAPPRITTAKVLLPSEITRIRRVVRLVQAYAMGADWRTICQLDEFRVPYSHMITRQARSACPHADLRTIDASTPDVVLRCKDCLEYRIERVGF